MQKVTFSDGIKVSNAKVTIDEVDYPVTPARYNGATPLSSTVMNTMQDNIEDAIDQNANNIGGKEYDNTATYDVGDIVKYQGQLYICTTAITTAEAWNSNHWQATDVLSSAGGNEIAIGSASDITGKTKIFVEESTQRLKYKDSTTGQFEDIAGDEVFIGDEEDAPEDAKIIIEDEDFGEDAGLSKAEVYVGAEEPTTGEKVWFRKGKNLCDGINQHCFLNINVNKCGTSTDDTGLAIPVKKGTYTISTKTTQARYRVAFVNSFPTGDSVTAYSGVNKDGTNESITIENSNNYKYLIVNATDLSSILVEPGSKATSYEAYIEPQIFVRNSNGVYEEFTKNDNVILYNNVDGSNEDITLNDNSDNYKYIDIYYFQQDRTYSFVRALPNTTVALSAPHVTDKGYAIGWAVRNIKISGNKITTATTDRYLFINVVSTNSLSGASKTNNVYITKVVGYK